jgi:hypothetical protein
LKLSEYVEELCDVLLKQPKVLGESADGKSKAMERITMTLMPEHATHRANIAWALKDIFLGPSKSMLDASFDNAQLLVWHNQRLSSQLESSLQKNTPKPKRAIQKSAKNGSIPKGKIEKAVNKVKDKQDAA